MLDPRKLMPLSIELCSAPMAVITEIIENTPMVMPVMVSAARNLFAPNEATAIRMISRNRIAQISDMLFIPQCRYRIEPRSRPGRGETGNQAGQDRHAHAHDH